ncbi:LegC family aminotransferase [Candidatus Formimonas warabiya]|uniref:Aminotransferase DegT n=1 Tax=Formimonas warabiya TaxID=1761012 RepID=A0A3G1KT35_FORW1|nr:LegC family aminotransferase [Candidatus Formimonas warabiya]ATW25683.1 aminotransferase DegT [Candidatus Formimonas warabiya]
MGHFIPLSVPNFQGRELAYVTDAVSQGWVSSGGEYVSRFEKQVAAYTKMPGAVACQTGTAGLHLAMLLCGVRTGDLVIAPTLTFIAAVNPIRYVGAEPVFMDCDQSLCLDPEKLKSFCHEECRFDDGILIHRATGRRVRAVVVVHVFGNMAGMEAIVDIAVKYGLLIIEDATEALGTYYTGGRLAGRMAGSLGHVGVFSFNGNKIITTGGGGMLVSGDENTLRKAKYLSTQAKDDELYYIHEEVGYNYRMTNVQAAIGVAQLEQLESFIRVKERNFALYCEIIGTDGPLRMLPFREDTRSNHWFYSLYLDLEEIGLDRDALIQELEQRGIQGRPIWGLIHEQKPYRGSFAYHIERAFHYFERVVNLPCSTSLSEKDVEKVAYTVLEFAGR